MYSKQVGLKHKPVLLEGDLSQCNLWVAPRWYHIIDLVPAEIHRKHSTENTNLKKVSTIIPNEVPPFTDTNQIQISVC